MIKICRYDGMTRSRSRSFDSEMNTAGDFEIGTVYLPPSDAGDGDGDGDGSW